MIISKCCINLQIIPDLLETLTCESLQDCEVTFL